MTNEEKQLLLRDLCARLPYSVFGLHRGKDLLLYVIDNSGAYMVLGYNAWFNLDTVPFKPYLRPMSSMTDEEREEFRMLGGVMSYSPQHNTWAISAFSPEAYDWLNKKMFDYRGLIPMGLALEASEGIYKID